MPLGSFFSLKGENDFNLAQGLRPYSGTTCTREDAIPDICHLFYTTTICDLEILHLKVRKFGTKVASRQNSVNFYPGANECKIVHCVNVHPVCRMTTCVYFKELSFTDTLENFTPDWIFLHSQRLCWLWQISGMAFRDALKTFLRDYLGFFPKCRACLGHVGGMSGACLGNIWVISFKKVSDLYLQNQVQWNLKTISDLTHPPPPTYDLAQRRVHQVGFLTARHVKRRASDHFFGFRCHQRVDLQIYWHFVRLDHRPVIFHFSKLSQLLF